MNALVSILLTAVFVGVVIAILNTLGYEFPDAEALGNMTKDCIEIVYASGVKELVCH